MTPDVLDRLIVECRYCRGTGSTEKVRKAGWPPTVYRCHACNGSGRVRATTEEAR